jgi:perosamine synthetase
MEKITRTIPLVEHVFNGNELAYLTDCICQGWVSSKGAYVKKFEAMLASWCRVRYAVAVSSGTGALHLALLAMGIGPGDEVIVPALSYVASANAILYSGACPVFVDIDPQTWNLNLSLVEAKITRKTKAIMVVHLYGHLVEMDRLLEIARKYQLWVVEDACEALGAEYKGLQAGAIGDVGCFSFYANKLITTGEGGMFVTDNDVLAEKVRSLRNQAAYGRGYHHTQIGFNYRMSNLEAAVGVAQMEQIEKFIAARSRVVQLYDQFLEGIPGISFYQEPAWGKNVCWLYSVIIEDDYGLSRDGLINRLEEGGIESKPFFEPLTTLPHFFNGEAFPVAQSLSGKGISLPSSINLGVEQVEYITRIIRKIPL